MAVKVGNAISTPAATTKSFLSESVIVGAFTSGAGLVTLIVTVSVLPPSVVLTSTVAAPSFNALTVPSDVSSTIPSGEALKV